MPVCLVAVDPTSVPAESNVDLRATHWLGVSAAHGSSSIGGQLSDERLTSGLGPLAIGRTKFFGVSRAGQHTKEDQVADGTGRERTALEMGLLRSDSHRPTPLGDP